MTESKTKLNDPICPISETDVPFYECKFKELHALKDSNTHTAPGASLNAKDTDITDIPQTATLNDLRAITLAELFSAHSVGDLDGTEHKLLYMSDGAEELLGPSLHFRDFGDSNEPQWTRQLKLIVNTYKDSMPPVSVPVRMAIVHRARVTDFPYSVLGKTGTAGHGPMEEDLAKMGILQVRYDTSDLGWINSLKPEYLSGSALHQGMNHLWENSHIATAE